MATIFVSENQRGRVRRATVALGLVEALALAAGNTPSAQGGELLLDERPHDEIRDVYLGRLEGETPSWRIRCPSHCVDAMLIKGKAKIDAFDFEREDLCECGVSIQANSNFCHKCGAKYKEVRETNPRGWRVELRFNVTVEAGQDDKELLEELVGSDYEFARDSAERLLKELEAEASATPG